MNPRDTRTDWPAFESVEFIEWTVFDGLEWWPALDTRTPGGDDEGGGT
jgi:hypothetical protein